MAHLPITHITLYKHGVGFFERCAAVSGEEVTLSFRADEMNDILKSLTVVDRGGGQVLGVDYVTPQNREERLADCSIRLGDRSSLYDLLAGLRGRQVRLRLDQSETVSGILLGLDESPERQPLAGTLVSLLRDGSDEVQVVTLGRVQGVEILDERGVGDLRFFLQTALDQENTRSVTLRLSPGEHDLAVSYVAPAPTWRVSYRLVSEPDEEGQGGRALLQGWGLFDNRLGEDLKDISLALVAGMPLSFVYDLTTPFTPERPVIKEERRVASGPVTFAAQSGAPKAEPAAEPRVAALRAGRSLGMAAPAPRRMDSESLQETVAVETTGEALGELFRYVIGTPVTVGRGRSALVPIISEELDYRKDLLYNRRQLPTHPVATLRLKNTTGLTLERGPATVIAGGEYVGEAILPLTAVGGEAALSYAVELGLKVVEQSGSGREVRRLSIHGAYLQFEEWATRWREYRLTNSTAGPLTVLVEHPRTPHYDLFDTPSSQERTAEHLRFAVTVPAWGETTLKVQERRLTRRREELQKQSYEGLQRYLQRGLLDRRMLDQLAKLLTLWETVADYEKKLAKCDQEREKIYQAQQQIQGNMQPLSQAGKEGTLRARYVKQLESTEERLRSLEQREADLKTQIERVRQELEERLQGME